MTERPQLPELPSDDDMDATRATNIDSTRGMPPSDIPTGRRPAVNLPPGANIPPPPPRRAAPRAPGERVPHARRVAKRGSARARRESGFYLPLWSLALMLIVVFMIAGGIVLAVIGLGGNTAPETAPVIIVNSPVPTERPSSFPLSPATPTIPPEVDPNVIAGSGDLGIAPPPRPTLALSGPTLPPVEISPTPRNITVGERVIVVSVGAQQLNVRDNPGVGGTSIVFRAEESSIFVIVEGPQQADGFTWWRIQDPNNTTRTGWAAANYLEVAPDQ